jgi:hypothetical protein
MVEKSVPQMKWFEATSFYGTQNKHLFNKKLKAISLLQFGLK